MEQQNTNHYSEETEQILSEYATLSRIQELAWKKLQDIRLQYQKTCGVGPDEFGRIFSGYLLETTGKRNI